MSPKRNDDAALIDKQYRYLDLGSIPRSILIMFMQFYRNVELGIQWTNL